MILLTDNIEFARRCIPQSDGWQACKVSTLAPQLAVLAAELFGSDSIMATEVAASEYWQYLFAVDCANESQYDVLSRLAVSGQEIPDRILCCAGSGEEFHGFKNRSWQACRGNIHLSAYIKPGREVAGAAVGFVVAAVLAALQTVRSLDLKGAATTIKWVNDVLVGGAKVGGVLARLQTQGVVTESAVIGIGLNVEQSPAVERDQYVPRVAALADYAAIPESCRHADVFPRLAESLGKHLEKLCAGHINEFLDLYRQHSVVLGRRVSICEDSRDGSMEVIARGLVESIGDSLQLYIKDHPKPVSSGRLRLENKR